MSQQNGLRTKILNQTVIKPEYLLLLLITLLAAGLRFYKLGEWSFWSDEMITIREAQKVFPDRIIPEYLDGSGLSLLLIGPTLMLLGEGEWSARLVPALIGVLTIPLMYFPVRKIPGRPPP
jgi:4-amino-4-deoxy-L-arabinose transferase-like glycosyltransferase